MLLLLVISTGTVFAEGSLISVKTDDSHYDEGDTIVISGEVTTIIGTTPAILQIFNEGNVVQIAQITIAQDGGYSHTVLAEGKLWNNQGNYTARVSYGEGNIAESEFSYSPETDAVVTTTNYEVDAGSRGTFDVKYSIKGATVENMLVDCKDEETCAYTLIVKIQSTDEGSITVNLPRDYIGAKQQNGEDDTFIIIIDGIEVKPEETSVVGGDSRTITINFEQGDSDIEIIGTYIVPEFGAIVMVVLTVGIMMTILITRNKFQMKI